VNLSNIVNRSSERSGSGGNFPSLSFRSLVPQAGTAHSNCRHRRWPPDPERRHLLQPDGARRCSRRPGSYPTRHYADGERETASPARRPLPLGMSYPQGLTLHAARPRSLRYGRTTLRLPAPPRAPLFGTLRDHRCTQRNPLVASAVALGMVGSVPAASTVPLPRRPWDPGVPDACGPPAGPDARARHWYENDLGWATVPGRPLRLLTGVRFDVLDVPAEAGAGALRHLAPGSPVALRGDRMELLVAAGGAEELPGLLDWLEWSAVALDLRVLGAGDAMEAPVPPATVAAGSVQGAAVWLRPPGPGGEVEASLPTMPAVGREGSAPDLVRLVDTVAAHCHRVRLRRLSAGLPTACRRDQPLAFS
jgi:hypothetical protein